MITLNQVREVFDRWLYIVNDNIIDINLACVISNQMPGDPVFLHNIGAPSSGKTEILRAIAKYPRVYELSTLTPNTLISGFITGRKKKDGDTSKLVQLSAAGKNIILIKDFTTILNTNHESRNEILCQVREIFDGYMTKPFGTGEDVVWRGKMAFITGVTSILDTFTNMNQTLGERFLCTRFRDEICAEAMQKASQSSGKEDEMRQEMGDVCASFLNQYDIVQPEITISDEMTLKITRLSHAVALCRMPVAKTTYGDPPEHLGAPEGPYRLIKQFSSISKGLAIIHNKKTIDQNIMRIIKGLGRDSIPDIRRMIISCLWENRGDWIKTDRVAQYIRFSIDHTQRKLQELLACYNPILERATTTSNRPGKPGYTWKLAYHMEEVLGLSEIFFGDYL